MTDDPRSQDSSAAAAANKQILVIYVALFEDRIDPIHQVIVILTRIVVLNRVPKLLTVTGRASRIGVEDDKPGGSVSLKFKVQTDSVHPVRTAMNVKHQGIFLGRVEIGGLYDPTLNLFAADRVIPDFLSRTELDAFEHVVVDADYLPGRWVGQAKNRYVAVFAGIGQNAG